MLTGRVGDVAQAGFLIEIAVHLYDIGKLTMGQARRMAKIDQITFQKELAKRNLFIKFEVEDLILSKKLCSMGIRFSYKS